MKKAVNPRKDKNKKMDGRFSDPSKSDSIAIMSAVPATRQKMIRDEQYLRTMLQDIHTLQADYRMDKDFIDFTPQPKDFAGASDRSKSLQQWYRAEHTADMDFTHAARLLVSMIADTATRAVMLTRYFSGPRVLTYAEIAEQMHYSEKWVQLRVSEAHHIIQDALQSMSKAGMLPNCFRLYLSNSPVYEYEFKEPETTEQT